MVVRMYRIMELLCRVPETNTTLNVRHTLIMKILKNNENLKKGVPQMEMEPPK